MGERVPTMRLENDDDDASYAVVGFASSGPLRVWPLEGTMTVGRLGSDANIALPSGVVSARHGQIAVARGWVPDAAPTQRGRVIYQDVGSSNGTYMGGKRLNGVVTLREGDALEFAPRYSPSNVELRLVLVRDVSPDLAWRRVPYGPHIQEIVFGRGDAGVGMHDGYVSERHASLYRSSKGLYVLDFASTNGVWVNGVRVQGSAPVGVGSVIRLGSSVIYISRDELWVGDAPNRGDVGASQPPQQSNAAGDGAMGASQPQRMRQEAAYEAPSEPAPDHQSRELEAAKKSAPGAMRQAWDSARMQTRDGAHRMAQPEGGLAIDIVEKNVWNRAKRKTLLRDVHLNVAPGDMVLILCGSGAGKTTFFNAVMGYDKAEGMIRLGDLDVYEEYERIKYQIGYVPQQDLVRLNDTVHETLFAAARLRMPTRSTMDACEERVRWASDMLGLSREGETLVGRLSGGQRKRLSIAVELVGDPALFFLDEPDSGLDGVMARSLLQNLKSIADLGKMVLVITHGPDRGADLFTKVLVLAKSERDGAGHLVCYGSVEETKSFFGVQTLEDVVRRINRPDEGGEGQADYYINKWEAR